MDRFSKENFPHWLEALSFLRGVSEGIVAILKLYSLLEVRDHFSEQRIDQYCAPLTL